MPRPALKGPLAAFSLLLVVALPSCGGSSESPSTAADPYIAKAADDEETEGLVQARDDIDAEMRARAAEKDEEIERLRKENENLRARLAARAKR